MQKDWREDLPSFLSTARRPDAKGPALPSPPRAPHPVREPEAFRAFLRMKNGLPYEPPTALDASKCVIPFGYASGHQTMRHVASERQAHEERVRLMQARRRHEALMREPWEDGEWTGC